MSEVEPSLILRLGSHSEKVYFNQLQRFFDGYIIAGNLVESTPAACASLVLKYSGRKYKSKYYLDPMTYAFGSYTDSTTNNRRTDLDWIKSAQKSGRNFKKSYLALGNQLGEPFAHAVSNAKRTDCALNPNTFSNKDDITTVCDNISKYQLKRIRQIFQNDSEIAEYADMIPGPACIFAPYFYNEPNDQDEWYKLNIQLMTHTVKLGLDSPVHGVLILNKEDLINHDLLDRIIQDIPKTGVNGIWLWFSSLNESYTTTYDINEIENNDLYIKLNALKKLIIALSKNVEVFNMHGGIFSLALSKFGLKGVSHGVGYGEQKDVVPVVGQGIPVVRYYMPKILHRLGVPDLERSFTSLNISTPQEFFNEVCDCAICKGIIINNINQFNLFGEMQDLKPGKTRSAQTPAAAKRCRYHFLLNRLSERDWIRSSTKDEIASFFKASYKKWGSQPSVLRFCKHLPIWERLLAE